MRSSPAFSSLPRTSTGGHFRGSTHCVSGSHFKRKQGDDKRAAAHREIARRMCSDHGSIGMECLTLSGETTSRSANNPSTTGKRMELGGFEPPTSWVRCARKREGRFKAKGGVAIPGSRYGDLSGLRRRLLRLLGRSRARPGSPASTWRVWLQRQKRDPGFRRRARPSRRSSLLGQSARTPGPGMMDMWGSSHSRIGWQDSARPRSRSLWLRQGPLGTEQLARWAPWLGSGFFDFRTETRYWKRGS
jgi:hypothetical protein